MAKEWNATHMAANAADASLKKDSGNGPVAPEQQQADGLRQAGSGMTASSAQSCDALGEKQVGSVCLKAETAQGLSSEKRKESEIDPCAGCTLNCGMHGFSYDKPGEQFVNDKKSVPMYVVLLGLLAALFAGGWLSSFVLNLLFH